MKKSGFVLIVGLVSMVVSCRKAQAPTNPTFHVAVTTEIIPYQNAPSTVDSTVAYYNLYLEWNQSGWRDTTKADSLAQWFAQSAYPITDMWFPDADDRCASPINTENVVSILLAAPDTSLRALGYSATTSVVSPCYVYYRHYSFIHVQNGG